MNNHPVIGELGVPVGTVVEIKATVIAGRELGTKAADGKYLLRVSEVNGHSLASNPYLNFSTTGFVRVNLAHDGFDLYELKNGTKASQLGSTEIRELEKGYVGKEVRLVVYEVGEYSGIPHNLPRDFPIWADHGFSFSTSLVVLTERP